MKYYIILLLLLLFSVSGCKKLPNGGIPTYIKIANPTIETKANQGAAVHTFSDLWLESQGKDLGAYEYPTTFAAYIAGQQDITVNAGIFYNTSTSERRIYDALDPFQTNLNFVQKDTITIEPVFKYKDGVDFIYIEDFTSTNNFTNLSRTSLVDPNNISGKAGAIVLNTNEDTKTSETISAITITEGQRVYLEFGLNTQNYGGFGIKSATDPTNTVPLGTFAPYENWIQNYFNLTNTINTIKDGEYHFYIDIQRGDLEDESITYIDNLKILKF